MGEVIDFKTRQKVKLKNEKMSKKQQDEGLRAYANSIIDDYMVTSHTRMAKRGFKYWFY